MTLIISITTLKVDDTFLVIVIPENSLTVIETSKIIVIIKRFGSFQLIINI